MAKKERIDYTIDEKPFYQTDLVAGQLELIEELQTEARKAGYEVDDMTSPDYGRFVVKYGIPLLAIALIPADQTQGDRFEDEDASRAAVADLKKWLRTHMEPSDIPSVMADFFAFSLRSMNPRLRQLPFPKREMNDMVEAVTQAAGLETSSSS